MRDVDIEKSADKMFITVATIIFLDVQSFCNWCNSNSNAEILTQ